jgi:hypothetical protein
LGTFCVDFIGTQRIAKKISNIYSQSTDILGWYIGLKLGNLNKYSAYLAFPAALARLRAIRGRGYTTKVINFAEQFWSHP